MAEIAIMKRIALSPLRKIIRDRMQESVQIPQFNLEIEIEMESILAAKKSLTPAPSVTAFLIWCCAQALRAKPELNGYFSGNEITLAAEVNIGVAISTPGGLIVPVIHQAEQRELPVLAVEMASLVEKAKKNRLSLDDVQGGTFTLSNLGMFGITKFIPLINPPQLAIMGVGGLCNGTKFIKGKMNSYQFITVTLAADHRALDGATAAEFLAKFKAICETINIEKQY